MTPFNLSIVGWTTRTDDPMNDTQTSQPQSENAWKGIVAVDYKYGFAISLDLVWKRIPCGEASSERRSYLLQVHSLRTLIDGCVSIDNGSQAYLTHWITHGM
jgi:hypothetical protein